MRKLIAIGFKVGIWQLYGAYPGKLRNMGNAIMQIYKIGASVKKTTSG